MAVLQLACIQLQKELKSNPKATQLYKKLCGPQEGHCEKRCEIQVGGQEMAVMVGYNSKNFNNNNSAEFVLASPHFTTIRHHKLSLLNFLLLVYHHSHFLLTTLDFISLFTMASLHTFFTAGLFLDYIITYRYAFAVSSR